MAPEPVFRIIQRHWSSMNSDQMEVRRYISNRPVLTYRSNLNLAKLLVRAKLKRPYGKCQDKNMSSSSSGGSNRSLSETFANNNHIAKLTDIQQHKEKCKDRLCPLHNNFKCTNRRGIQHQRSCRLQYQMCCLPNAMQELWQAVRGTDWQVIETETDRSSQKKLETRMNSTPCMNTSTKGDAVANTTSGFNHCMCLTLTAIPYATERRGT